MLTIRAMSSGAGYEQKHLSCNDYYAEGERVSGQWRGEGAALLGVEGTVRAEDFEAVRQGHDPTTEQFLRQRASADRIAADGSRQSSGRHLYDFTFSAPKSVSILAELNDPRLLRAHDKAVGEAVAEMEKHASTRVRIGGANDDRISGNMVMALYRHTASRELDPQVHTHCVAANMTYDATEQSWKALQAGPIYQRRAYLTEVYRNALAREVEQLGYEIEQRRDARGKESGFEIQGLSPELLKQFSRRSAQKEAAIEQFIRKEGRPPTDNEVAVLVVETRAEKLTEISTAEVKAQQVARLTAPQEQELRKVKEAAAQREPILNVAAAQPSLMYAENHIFGRLAVARDYEVLAEALRHG